MGNIAHGFEGRELEWVSKAEEHRKRAAKVLASIHDMADLDSQRMALSIADAYEALAKAS